MRYMLAHQMAAPNSPQWFNTGLHWAYGIDGPSQGHYFVDPFSEKLNASEYKTLLASLLLVVGIMMGVQTFVLEKGQNLFIQLKNNVNITELGNKIIYFSNNFPIGYAIFSIFIVIFIGVTFSYVRAFIHYLRYDYEWKKASKK